MPFHWPYLLLALPVVLAGLLALFAAGQRARQRGLTQFASARLLPLLLASHSPALRRFKHALLATGVLLAVLALARPVWGYDWQEQRVRGVDVIFVIDTSKSMLTQDVQPSRLERAKLAIYDCLDKIAGNRIGLVAFAGQAFLQCPLTLDYDAFRQSLETVDTTTIARGGTDIAAGLDEAATALENSGNHKIIVLITDGEDLEGQGVQEAHTLAEQGVIIYTVGVGTPQGEIIPVRDAQGRTDYLHDDAGHIVKSSLDSKTLSAIAEATKGFYQPLGATGEGLVKVFDDGIKKIPEQDITSKLQRQPVERFQWPLALAMLLLAVESLMGTRRPGWNRRRAILAANLSEPIPPTLATASTKTKTHLPPVVAVLWLLALGLAATPHLRAQAQTDAPPAPATPTAADESAAPTPASAPASPAKNYTAKAAQNYFQKGDFKTAAEAYSQAAEATPQDGRLRYNQGTSLYRTGDFDAAAQAFSKTLSSPDLPLQQRAYYNLGNSHYRLGQGQQKEDPKKTVASWESAMKDFQSALELNSADADARYNLDLVKKQLEELKKQLEQQEKQQQQQQDKQDQKQDDQKQQDQQNQKQQDQNQQNQPQQNNQSQQNQQQQNQQQNQQNSGQKQSQDKSSQQNQNQKQQNNGQNQQQNQSNQQKPSDSQQNSPGTQGQNKPQNQPGADKNQPQKQPGAGQNQPQNQNQAQNGNQKQPQPGDKKGTEPGGQKANQPTPSATNAAGGAAKPGTDDNPPGEGQTVMVGVMTREEARQVLDSLKASEHKLPASRYDSDKPGAQTSPEQSHKDW